MIGAAGVAVGVGTVTVDAEAEPTATAATTETQDFDVDKAMAERAASADDQQVSRSTSRPSLAAVQRATKSRHLPTNGQAVSGGLARSVEPTDPREIAREMLADYGWGEQFSCLDSLYVSESDWDHTATNPYSGAYGIPQSLPAEKMAAAGPDWRTNPATQIEWGLDYIRSSYGSPCSAWAFKQSNNWY